MEEIAIYIHFPYCELKCPYCDFNSHVKTDHKEQEHLKAFKNEIDFFTSKLQKTYKLRSIFFGGGTPSLMHPSTVFKILDYIKQNAKLKWEEPEVTLEANPSSSEYVKFIDFKNAGINRLSIGVQSFNEANLKFLGRKHNADEAKNAILMAKEVFKNYSFDLIYCLPNQTLKDWNDELEFALKNYANSHISAYTLTIEKGTKFFKMHQNKEFTLPQDEDDFYKLTNEILQKYGFDRYEVSNYAKKGFECRHNLAYWQSIDYIGIGAGAHGRITNNGKRYATQNFASPDKYLQLVLANNNALQVFEELSNEELIKEALLMNLRTHDGINLKNFEEKFRFSLIQNLNQKHLNAILENNLAVMTKDYLKLTEGGMSLANSIALKLLPSK